MQDIPGHATWRSIEAQTLGWSSDRIFHIVDEQGQHLLLRTNDSSQYVNKRDEFQWTQHLAAKGIAMSQPLDFGLFDSGRQVYSLLSWIEGKDGAQWVAEQPAVACYELGLQAGQILQQIHSVAAPEGTENAEQQMRAIYRKKLEQYRSCGHKVAHEQDFLQFLEQHFHLLADTPLVFLHGDYHLNNMIVGADDQLSIIDFNRCRFGDPARDFNRLALFSCNLSSDFARGQIDGYCAGHADPVFLTRMAFYAAFDTFFSVLWAMDFGEQEVQATLQRTQKVWEDFAGFSRHVPRWYGE
ncbi:hypothetical protein BLX41_16985 [Pseudomonas protegens]|uniref:aminoglycoside phosphotransferase family protein n=1 Tax=Pseudomonas protegens TaxID=380021 RepID=UPI000F4CE24B|nr:aminoglycoside phosphotransferase family protein [Pseudomonas protegens]ROL74314.1 hypothetical protein BLX41_16985 [Pseudomonas protegens]